MANNVTIAANADNDSKEKVSTITIHDEFNKLIVTRKGNNVEVHIINIDGKGLYINITPEQLDNIDAVINHYH